LKSPLSYPHEAEWTPFQTHYFSENLAVPGIQPGTSGSVGRNSEPYTTEVVKEYCTEAGFSYMTQGIIF
jgi:hypothetical protein